MARTFIVLDRVASDSVYFGQEMERRFGTRLFLEHLQRQAEVLAITDPPDPGRS
jgi:hypothetical protein